MSIRPRPSTAAHSAAMHHQCEGPHGHASASSPPTPPPSAASPRSRRSRRTCRPVPTSASSAVVDSPQAPGRWSCTSGDGSAGEAPGRRRRAEHVRRRRRPARVRHLRRYRTARTSSTCWRRVRVPVITVLHTVLADPTPHQHEVLARVVAASSVDGDHDRGRPPAARRRAGASTPGRSTSSRTARTTTAPPRRSAPALHRRSHRADLGAARRGQGDRVGAGGAGRAADLRPAPRLPDRRPDPPEGARARRRGLPAPPGAPGRPARPRRRGAVRRPLPRRPDPAADRRGGRRRPAALRLARPGHVRRPDRGGRRRQAGGVDGASRTRSSCSPAAPGSSSRGATRPRSRPRSAACSPSPGWPARWPPPPVVSRRGLLWPAVAGQYLALGAEPAARAHPVGRLMYPAPVLRPPGPPQHADRPVRARPARPSRAPSTASASTTSPAGSSYVAPAAPVAAGGRAGGDLPAVHPVRAGRPGAVPQPPGPSTALAGRRDRRGPLGACPVGAGHARPARRRDPRVRRAALDAAVVGLRQRSPSWHATAYAALGAAEVLAVAPGEPAARALLRRRADAARPTRHRPGVAVAGRAPHLRQRRAPRGADRARRGAGRRRHPPARARPAATGSSRRRRTTTTCRSTPVGRRRDGDERPGFDQQPIEVAALAEACWRAFRRDAPGGLAGVPRPLRRVVPGRQRQRRRRSTTRVGRRLRRAPRGRRQPEPGRRVDPRRAVHPPARSASRSCRRSRDRSSTRAPRSGGRRTCCARTRRGWSARPFLPGRGDPRRGPVAPRGRARPRAGAPRRPRWTRP